MKESLIQFGNNDWEKYGSTSHLCCKLSKKIHQTSYSFNSNNYNDYTLLICYIRNFYSKYIKTGSDLEINISHEQ